MSSKRFRIEDKTDLQVNTAAPLWDASTVKKTKVEVIDAAVSVALNATKRLVGMAGGNIQINFGDRDDKIARDRMVEEGRAALQLENPAQLKVADFVIERLKGFGIRMTPEYTPGCVKFDKHFYERQGLNMTQEEWLALKSSGEICQIGGSHVIDRQGAITGWEFAGAVVEFYTKVDWRTGKRKNDGRRIEINAKCLP